MSDADPSTRHLLFLMPVGMRPPYITWMYLNDAGAIRIDPTGEVTWMAVPAEPEPTVRVTDPDGVERNVVLRTKSGKVITEDDIEVWADEAERGYDITELRER